MTEPERTFDVAAFLWSDLPAQNRYAKAAEASQAIWKQVRAYPHISDVPEHLLTAFRTAERRRSRLAHELRKASPME